MKHLRPPLIPINRCSESLRLKSIGLNRLECGSSGFIERTYRQTIQGPRRSFEPRSIENFVTTQTPLSILSPALAKVTKLRSS